jgi:mannose-6-phosphate isomerase-like protein (cupin superfamily)
MYNPYETSPCNYCIYASGYSSNYRYNDSSSYPCSYCYDVPRYNPDFSHQYADEYVPFPDETEYYSRFDDWQPEEDDGFIELKDYGPEPFVVNINEATKQNDTFRSALWTGSHLQLTLMSINVGEDIGLELHPDLDQFIRVEEGQGLVKMGDSRTNLDFQANVYDDFAFIIPSGKWHNLINTGNTPLKLYSIYAPPQHPQGTVHETKADAIAAEEEHGN